MIVCRETIDRIEDWKELMEIAQHESEESLRCATESLRNIPEPGFAGALEYLDKTVAIFEEQREHEDMKFYAMIKSTRLHKQKMIDEAKKAIGD